MLFGPGRSLGRLACAGFVVVLAACGRSASPEEAPATGVTVNVRAAELGTLRDVANASGVVVPSTAGEYTVIAPDVARVVSLPKVVGDPVAVGDVLVRFEIPALTQEIAALELGVLDAEARVNRAKAELAKLTPLFERGLASRNAHDASRLEVSAAESGAMQARSRLETARSSDDRSVVRAAFNGVVTEVFHNIGDAVRPSGDDPVLRMVDPTRVQVAVELPLAELARVVPGQSATIQAIAGATAEPATVVSKVDAVSATTPTGQVRLGFINPATLALTTPVSAEILLDQRTQVVVVPDAAVQRDGLGPYVMVVGDDFIARRRDVRLGLTTRTNAQIAAGLAVGERVIVSGLADVREGTPIVVAP
jgi:RND family efflux transporter MFP subunit